MSTKLFIIAISVIGVALIAGVFVSLNRSATETTTPSTSTGRTDTVYTLEDVKIHDSKSSCWTIISGSVYDITSYIPRHPGGEEILRACGTDATSLFTMRRTSDGESVGSGSPHSPNAEEQLEKLKIGELAS